MNSRMLDESEVHIEHFSSSYELVSNAEVVSYPGDEAVMDYQLYDILEKQFGDPVLCFVGGRHYYFKRQKTVPERTVAVPSSNHDDPSAVLIKK